MNALQRLQQRILASSDDIFKDYAVTPKATRLLESIKKNAYTVAGSSILAGMVIAGPTLDHMAGIAQNDDQTMTQFYDLQRELLVAQENVIEIKRTMVQSPPMTEESFQELARDLRTAKNNVVQAKAGIDQWRTTHASAQDDQLAIASPAAPKMKN